MELAILFLEYDSGKYPKAFERFTSFTNKLRFCNKRYYIIDNRRQENAYLELSDTVFRIDGDNSCWEFSGWQRGLTHLRQNNIHYDAVLLANDAFYAYGWSLLEFSSKINLNRWLANGNSFLGHIDTKDIYLEIFGDDVSSWICTNCYFLPREIIENIGSVVSFTNDNMNAIVSEKFPGNLDRREYAKFFKNSNSLNDNYKRMVIDWLTEEWHGKIKINETTWEFFRSKLRSLLNESLLTSRIKSSGYKIESYENYID